MSTPITRALDRIEECASSEQANNQPSAGARDSPASSRRCSAA
ncbi:MAG: hypothetical protein QM714_11410 [Nocardioides sp.]